MNGESGESQNNVAGGEKVLCITKLQEILNIFLSTCLNICFGCSKEPSQ